MFRVRPVSTGLLGVRRERRIPGCGDSVMMGGMKVDSGMGVFMVSSKRCSAVVLDDRC